MANNNNVINFPGNRVQQVNEDGELIFVVSTRYEEDSNFIITMARRNEHDAMEEGWKLTDRAQKEGRTFFFKITATRLK